MGIIDRVILSIYTLLLAFLSLGVILISLRLISLEWVQTSIAYLYGHWEAGLVAAVFFLVSVRLLLAGVRSRAERLKNTIVHHTDMGDVNISLDAVRNLVEKISRNTRGVRGVKVFVTHDEQGLKVMLRAVISPESNVPSVSAEVQRRVHEYIKNTVGVELSHIHILVENISNEFKTKHRVE
ncbi:alkaline shock response membrane anchor protein AmaP [Propionispora hippei]|uniref:Asp23 family, cell envelope-related function n=1 Tax=Propionispora hippei DSM 15287 TaxID=1123003 RepID=A0A1M6B0L0_9FIRM|nr:alkaline shock response membrane anchor protein AmaP [Propionispora hippei]SHI42252.1 Asp23 family, cell envelope-related function [Propionispora hippei DSM 15287]